MLSFRNKLILAFITFGILLIGISYFLIFKIQEISLKANSIEKAQEVHQQLDSEISHYVTEMDNALLGIENSMVFNDYLADANHHSDSFSKRFVIDLFSSLVTSSNKFMSLRYIDKNGDEKLRVDRNNETGEIVVMDTNQLQNKSSRYYFKKTIENKNLIWYSKIDLNMEFGKIEKPIRPVIRVAKTINYQNKLAGILIINIHMEDFLDNLISSPLFNIFMVDKNGYFIIHPQKEKSWSLYLKTNYHLENEFGSNSDCILNNDECINEQFYAKNIQVLNNQDGVKVIVQPKMVQIHQSMQEQFIQLLYISLAVLTLSFPIAYFFSMTPTRLKEKVDFLNEKLEEQIAEKVNELKITNKVLQEIISDRTKELEEINVKYYHQVTTDFLTQVPNRRHFFEMSDRCVQLSHRKRKTISIIIVDIDFFKQVNDQHGHDVADQVLKEMAKNLSSQLRSSDIFARIGGQEFALLLPDTELEQAVGLAEKIRHSIEEHVIVINKLSIKVTISAGVTQSEKDDQDLSVIMLRAEKALRRAKASGTNKVMIETFS